MKKSKKLIVTTFAALCILTTMGGSAEKQTPAQQRQYSCEIPTAYSPAGQKAAEAAYVKEYGNVSHDAASEKLGLARPKCGCNGTTANRFFLFQEYSDAAKQKPAGGRGACWEEASGRVSFVAVK